MTLRQLSIEYNKNIGDRIRALMKKQQVSQVSVAKYLGMPQTRLSKYLTSEGGVGLNIDRQEKIENMLTNQHSVGAYIRRIDLDIRKEIIKERRERKKSCGV